MEDIKIKYFSISFSLISLNKSFNFSMRNKNKKNEEAEEASARPRKPRLK